MGKSISTQVAAPGFRHFCQQLLSSLLPSSCLLCGARSAAAPVCPDCERELPALPDCHCPLCLDRTTHGERCGACQMQPPHFDRIHALHAYAFPVDHLVHQLKYAAHLALARYWGEQLAGTTRVAASRVMPLPLHPRRLAERGYNQSLEIARWLARSLQLPLDRHSLIKTRPTRPQAELPLRARKANLKGVFECREDLEGEHVLLVDDVLTTGTTLDEAARTLKLHGAAQVSACVVARTLRR
ncbi:MAG: ComF family protein [Azovibrio sp.]|uniref:ComF family protein n=1 Tax=Azovibrio sp. TaxID=1872673 RepID=UPI003C78C6FC